MIKLVNIAVLFFLLGSCQIVQFQQQELYDHYETTPSENRVESIIFSEAQGSLWNSLFYCGDFKISNKVAYEGKNSIKLSWDKSKGCEWIGFGNSFSNWTAVDMSEERKHKALTFYVRTQEKTNGALPIVAALEDFSGGGSYLYIDTKKYLNGLLIDTNWRQVIVPLWDFPIMEEMVNIRAIKQMQFQLEGAGSFYLDEIQLMDYSPNEYQQFRASVEAMKPKGNPNQVIFQAADFEFSSWKSDDDNCQKLELNNNLIQWTYSDCNATWGINWNGWYQINFRGITENAVLSIKLKTSNASAFNLFLEDFKGKNSMIYQDKGSISSDWRTIQIPLKELELEKNGFTLDQIKQLRFEGIGNGQLEIESMNIIDNK
ncbi:MAG: hypothetical protein RL264_872 [Bacteroidota bacterium]